MRGVAPMPLDVNSRARAYHPTKLSALKGATPPLALTFRDLGRQGSASHPRRQALSFPPHKGTVISNPAIVKSKVSPCKDSAKRKVSPVYQLRASPAFNLYSELRSVTCSYHPAGLWYRWLARRDLQRVCQRFYVY